MRQVSKPRKLSGLEGHDEIDLSSTDNTLAVRFFLPNSIRQILIWMTNMSSVVLRRATCISGRFTIRRSRLMWLEAKSETNL